MKTLYLLTNRNVKIFFKDKGMVISSLVTPLVLLLLYATFLKKIYKDSFLDAIPEGFNVDMSIVDGLVGGELISSLLAVCCITVAFVSNLMMVQDKANKNIKDFTISPVKSSMLSLSYFLAAMINTLIVCMVTMIIGFVYLAIVGWYLTVFDVVLIILDVTILVMFGTALSCIINSFLTTQGQMSAFGTIISAGYGFICGAYMPLSNFPVGLQKVLAFLPGTYGTSLIRNHYMRGSFEKMEDIGFPKEVISAIRDGVDCNIYFFDKFVPTSIMYTVMIISVLVLIGIFVIINFMSRNRKS